MPETDDLATLNSLDDAAVASILEDRYSHRRIYTRVNSMLISINPYEELGLYSTAVLDEYCRVGNGGPPPPPHAFAVAAEAFSGLLSSQSQSVLVTGESGAGKTETCRRLLQYLAHAANRGGAADTRALHEALSQTSCVLEAFGNARTVMNDNSSRYGKFLTLRYDKTARLQGASFSTFLLEQTRVVRVAPAERSFHVFYALLAGLSSTEAAELQLDCLAPNGYTYIATSDAVGGPAAADEAARDASALSEIGAALELLGTPRATQWQAWRVLAAVLRLGNVVVSAAADGGTEVARVDEGESAASLEAAAQLLGVSHTALSSAVTTRCLKAGGEFIQTPQTCTAAAEVRDGLAKALYSRLFDRLVAAINDSPQVAGSDGGGEGGGGSGAGPFVGLLDIFGFEDFESNSLEQLLINFSNEHLQAIFNSIIFSAAQAEAEAEGVPPPQFDAEAVSNVSTITLFSAPHSGLFALLNEECVFPNGTDESFVAKLHAANKEHSRLSVLQPEGSAFRVAHYAGSVKYQAKGFLVKNKAPFSEDLLVLLRTSSEPFVATLFAQEAAASQAGKRGRGFRGVVGGYAAELDELLRVIRSSTAHFVRCIKPNVRKAARCFDEPVVMRQLRCGGVLEAVRVFASGFPDRMPLRDFVGTYCSVVAPSKLPPHPPGGPPPQGDAPTAWERGACAAILRAFDVADGATALGHTKVFLGAGVAAHCKAKREARLAGLIAVVQAAARGLLARRSLRRRAALREKEEERERQIAALQAQQEAERAATRGAVGLRRKASFEREASVKRRQQQERAAAAKRTEEATASWAAREAELTKLHTELTRQVGRKQAALAAELAQLTAALRKAEERNAALERAQAEERAAAAAREVELQTAVSHWRDEAALAAQREQQASEMGEARLAQAVEREGEARDEASFFRARFQELALSFARAQDPAPPRSRPPNADGGGFFGVVASLIGGGAKPRPSRERGRTSLSASRPAGDAPSSPAEKARAPPQAPLFSPRTMSIAEEPYSPPQPPAPRDAPTPADATALASYLGLHPVRDAKLMWIAEAAAAEPLPEGWSEVVDPGGRLYYSNGVTGESSRVHPRDEEFRLLVMRSKLEQMHSAPAAQPSAGDWSTIRMKSLEQSLSSAASAPVRALVQRSADRRGGAPRLTFEMLLDEDTRLPWMEAVLREGPRGAAFELLLEGGAAEKSEHLVRLSGPSSSVLVRRERRDAPLPEDGPVGEEEELAAVIFVEVLGEADESGARGGEEAPYSMELVVPAAKRGGATQAHKPRGPSDTLLQRYGRGETEGLLVFVGQLARSAAAEAPSAAVRLSLPKTDSGNLLLQTSGRRGANRATLEYRDPLSPLAAFSAALALVHWSERAQSALARAAIGKGRLSVG